MAAGSNLATVEPPKARPSRAASAPLIGALGGALAGFAATGDPIGCIAGRVIGFIGRGAQLRREY